MVKVEFDPATGIGYGDTIFQSREEAITRMKNDPEIIELCHKKGTDVTGLIREGVVSFSDLLLG